MSGKRKRQIFTDEFKQDAVRLVLENGYSCREVARRLGVNTSNVTRWVRVHRDETEPENRRLLKENKRVQMEREILKKAAAFFAKESD